jgi:hypothetical protein
VGLSALQAAHMSLASASGVARTVSVFVTLPRTSAGCLRTEEIFLKLSVNLIYLQNCPSSMKIFVLKGPDIGIEF